VFARQQANAPNGRYQTAVQFETRRLATEAEPVGLLTEGAAGIAVIVLAIIGLAGVAAAALAAIATIVIGVGLMVQAVGAAMLMVSASFTGAVLRIFTASGTTTAG
jgi:hypothetical protein